MGLRGQGRRGEGRLGVGQLGARRLGRAMAAWAMLGLVGCDDGDDATRDADGGGGAGGAGNAGGVGGAGNAGGAGGAGNAGGEGGAGNAGGEGGAGNAGGGAPALLDRYVLEGDDLVPESGDFEAESRAFYLGSLPTGRVIRVDADGTQSVFAEPPGAGYGTLGVRVDVSRRRLWTCAVQGEDRAGFAWAFDLATGARTHTVDLSAAAPGASCNDVAFDLQGFAYFTDRENPNIYRVDPATQTAEIFVTDPRLTGSIGLNGIVLTEDARALIVSVYVPAALYRVDLGAERTVAQVALTGDALAGSSPLHGADGMRLANGELLVALIDRLARVRPTDGTWAAATVQTEGIVGGTSAVIVAEGDVFGVQSDIVNFVLGRALTLPFTLERLGPVAPPR